MRENKYICKYEDKAWEAETLRLSRKKYNEINIWRERNMVGIMYMYVCWQ